MPIARGRSTERAGLVTGKFDAGRGEESGEGRRIRTVDLLLKRELLYQLSYAPDGGGSRFRGAGASSAGARNGRIIAPSRAGGGGAAAPVRSP